MRSNDGGSGGDSDRLGLLRMSYGCRPDQPRSSLNRLQLALTTLGTNQSRKSPREPIQISRIKRQALLMRLRDGKLVGELPKDKRALERNIKGSRQDYQETHILAKDLEIN